MILNRGYMLQKIEKYSILTYFRGRKNLSVIQKKHSKTLMGREGGIIFLTQKKEGGNEKLRTERVKEVPGEKLYEELLEIKDRSAFRFFNKCFLVNQLISKYGCFLKFFERRDKYRFLINKKLM